MHKLVAYAVYKKFLLKDSYVSNALQEPNSLVEEYFKHFLLIVFVLTGLLQ